MLYLNLAQRTEKIRWQNKQLWMLISIYISNNTENHTFIYIYIYAFICICIQLLLQLIIANLGESMERKRVFATIILFALQVMLRTNGQMLQCQYGHFLASSHNNNYCIECLTSCSMCTDLVSPCKNCAQTQYLSQATQTCSSCRVGEKRCTSVAALECLQSYALVYGKCVPQCQIDNCELCLNLTACSRCSSGFVISKNRQICVNTNINGSNPPVSNKGANIRGSRLLQQLDLPEVGNAVGVVNDVNTDYGLDLPVHSTSAYTVVDNNIKVTQDEPVSSTVSSSEAQAQNKVNQVVTVNKQIQSKITPEHALVQSQIVLPVVPNMTNILNENNDTPQPPHPTIVEAQALSTGQISIHPNNVDNNQNKNIKINYDISTNNTKDVTNINTNSKTNTNSDEHNNGNSTVKPNSSIVRIEHDGAIIEYDKQLSYPVYIGPTMVPSVQPQTISTPPPPVFIASSCPTNMYYSSADSKCMSCSLKCATCIVSANQCIECAQGFRKQGWKCIYNQYVSYQLTLTPQNSTSFNISDIAIILNQLKQNIVNMLLTKEYKLKGVAPISLTKVSVNNDTVALNGIIQLINNTQYNTSENMKTSLENKMKSIKKIGIFNIKNYAFVSYPQSSTFFNSIYNYFKDWSNKIWPTPTTNTHPQNNNPNSSTTQSNGSPALILIPIVLALIALAILVTFCYCRRLCCFKKLVHRDQKQSENHNYNYNYEGNQPIPVSSDRVFAKQNKQQQSTQKQQVFAVAPSKENNTLNIQSKIRQQHNTQQQYQITDEENVKKDIKSDKKDQFDEFQLEENNKFNFDKL